MKKIGIFYINTGGGHSGTAKALFHEFSEHHSQQVNPVLVDVLRGGSFWARWFMERGYALAVNNFPYYWRFIYWLSKLTSVMRGESRLFAYAVTQNITAMLKKEQFDIIVITHFFLVTPIVEILKKEKINIPIFSIVTDPFTPPFLWFINKNIRYLVFSDQVRCLAEARGVRSADISVIPPLISRKFWQARLLSRDEIRVKLDLPLDKKIILIAAGGEGLYRGSAVLKQLVNLPNDCVLVVICGREERLFRNAVWLQQKYPRKILSVYGFVHNMEELMAAADLVVGKAGPATIFEALAVGRPLVLTHYLWEQEKGNCEFVVNGGWGIYEPRVKKILIAVNNFLYAKNGYQKALQQIRNHSNLNGVEMAARIILQN